MKVAILLLVTPTAAFRAVNTLSPRPLVVTTASSYFRGGVPPIASLPAVATLATACIAPTLLGYWKTEYGVSYAYGAAMATFGALLLPTAAASGSLATAHALVLILYGVRLNGFLLFRELNVERFRTFREKIEARTKKQGNRLARTPFVLGCSFLYYCMGAPTMLTAAAPATSGSLKVVQALAIGFAYIGFGVAAVGDAQKYIAKAKGGENTLVRTGVYKYLRHPNYTGELLLWLSSVVAALAAAPAALASGMPVRSIAGWLTASIVGFAGIGFVLINAATGLEKKQKEKYGTANGQGGGPYEAWVATTWAGPTK